MYCYRSLVPGEHDKNIGKLSKKMQSPTFQISYIIKFPNNKIVPYFLLLGNIIKASISEENRDISVVDVSAKTTFTVYRQDTKIHGI